MKILMICGSPKGENSTSNYILQIIAEKLQIKQNNKIRYIHDYKEEETIVNDLLDVTTIILSFPLYVDGIPASLLHLLQRMEQVVKDKERKCIVYTLVNNGFYDARQNHLAIDMVWKWCDKCGFEKGYAIGLGASGVLKASPMGVGPNINVGKALNQLTKDIEESKKKETIYVEPNFPRFLYKIVVHVIWGKTAKSNGLKVKALRKKIN